MLVTREALNEMFVNLEMPMAPKWSEKRLVDKLTKLPDVVDEDTDAGDSTELLQMVLEAVANEEEFEISDGGGDDDDELVAKKKVTKKKTTKKKTTKKKTTKKKTTKKKAPVTKKKTEDEEPVKKKVSKKKPVLKKPVKTKQKAPVRVGVIATIVTCLEKATKRKPITKEEILDVLVEKFPDRESDSMKRTIGLAVPYKLKKEKGLDVQKSDKGFWIAS